MKIVPFVLAACALWAASARGAYVLNDDYSTDTSAQYTEYSSEGPHRSAQTLPGGLHEGDSHTWTYTNDLLQYDRWDRTWQHSLYVHNTARLPDQAVVCGTFDFYT